MSVLSTPAHAQAELVPLLQQQLTLLQQADSEAKRRQGGGTLYGNMYGNLFNQMLEMRQQQLDSVFRFNWPAFASSMGSTEQGVLGQVLGEVQELRAELQRVEVCTAQNTVVAAASAAAVQQLQDALTGQIKVR